MPGNPAAGQFCVDRSFPETKIRLWCAHICRPAGECQDGDDKALQGAPGFAPWTGAGLLRRIDANSPATHPPALP